MSFQGTGVAVVTPFDDAYKIDEAALRRVVRHLIDGGVEYLVLMGTTGESATLSKDEKIRAIEVAMEENDGKLPIVLGVGGNHTASVCEQAAEFQESFEPAAFLSVSPYYNKPTQQGILMHYQALALSIDTPIIVYNVPGRTASNILPQTILQLAHDHKNIVAIKEASGNVEQGMEIIAGQPKGFEVLSGDDTLAIAQVAAGYKGVISVAANSLPFLFSQMVRHGLQNELSSARSLHYRILELMQLNFVEGNPAGVKAQLAALGLCKRTVRLPLAPASDELLTKMKQKMVEAGLLKHA